MPSTMGCKECLFLGCTEGLGMDDDLVLVIHHGDTVIALDHAVGGLHGGTLIVGDIALYGLALLARLVIMLFEPGPDLLDVLLKGGNVLSSCSVALCSFLSSVSLWRVMICRMIFSIFFFFLARSSLVPLHSLEALEESLTPSMANSSLPMRFISSQTRSTSRKSVMISLSRVAMKSAMVVKWGGVAGEGHKDDVLPTALLDLPA